MARSSTSRRTERGFTLLEVIIAFVIMALIIGASFDIFSTGLRQAVLTGDYTGALVRAESRLAVIGASEPLAIGVKTGRFDQTYAWRTEIAPVPPEDPDAAEPQGSHQLYDVAVSVFWGEGADRRDVTLRSQRLGEVQ